MITRIKSASNNSKIDLEIRLDWQPVAAVGGGSSQPSTSPALLSPTYTRSELFDSTNASAIINPLEMDKQKVDRTKIVKKKSKVSPEKSIKKLPQILLNDEFENYAKTFGKNYNNIENLLASKSLNEFKSNQLTNSQVYLTHPNTTSNKNNITNNNNQTVNTNLKASLNNNTNSTANLDRDYLNNNNFTMKSKIAKEKSFYLDETDLQSPLNHNNVHVLELEIKNIPKDSDMKSQSSDENTGYNQTVNTNNYLNDYQQHIHTNNLNHQHNRIDAKHNLKLEHFKFSPSNKLMTPQNSAMTNMLSQSNGINSSKKNVLLTIQNQNLLVQATLNASIQTINTNNVSNSGGSNNNNNINLSRHKVLRSKVFNNGLSSTNSNNNSTPPDIHNESDAYVNLSNSTNLPSSSQQQAIQQKLTYLKRYVANGLANKNSLQFSDGYWNRIPGSKLKTTTIRPNNSSNQINLLASFTNNGNGKLVTSTNMKSNTANGIQKTTQNSNFISLQNVNGQLLPNRELSIIDLQLPMRKQQNSSNTGANAAATISTTQHQLISLNKNKTKAISQSMDYYASNSQHSNATDTNNEVLPMGPAGITTNQSKIMLTAVIKPQLNLANQDKNNLIDTQFTEISQFFSSNDTSANASGGYEHLLANDKVANKLNEMNMANYKNKNYFKYVMNQQKKRQQNQSSGHTGNASNYNNVSNMNNSISNEALNSPNVSSIVPTSSFNKRQAQLVNHEVPIPMHSNLNNISSNALLIRRLKF